MVDFIKPSELPAASTVYDDDAIVVDNAGLVQKATPEQVVDAGAPVASQAEAIAGSDNTKRMTALRVRQVLDDVTAPSVLRAQAWAESSGEPDPAIPDSRSSKSWAEDAEAARDETVNQAPFAVKDAADFFSRTELVKGARYWSKDGLAWDVLPSGVGDFVVAGAQVRVVSHGGVVSVSSFSAAPGGVAIQQAVSAVNPIEYQGERSSIQIPSGTYSVDSTIDATGHPKNKFSMSGAGMMETVLEYTGSADVPVLDMGWNFTGLESTGFRRVSDLMIKQAVNKASGIGLRWRSANAIGGIERLFIDGFKEGIRTRDDWGCYYKHIYVSNCGTGFYAERQPNASVFENIYFQQCDTGLFLNQPWSASVRNCAIERDSLYAITVSGGNAIIDSCYFEAATTDHIADLAVTAQGGELSPVVTLTNCLLNNDSGLSCVDASGVDVLNVTSNTVVTPTNSAKPLVRNPDPINFTGPRQLNIEGNTIRYLPSISTPAVRAVIMPLIGDGLLGKAYVNIGENGVFTRRGTILPGTSNLTKISTSTSYNDPSFIDGPVSDAMEFYAGPQLWTPNERTGWVVSTIQGDTGTVVDTAVEDNHQCVSLTRDSGAWSHSTAYKQLDLNYLKALFGEYATIALHIRCKTKAGRVVWRGRDGATVRETNVGNLTTGWGVSSLIKKFRLNQDAIVEIGIRASITGYFCPVEVEIIGLKEWYDMDCGQRVSQGYT